MDPNVDQALNREAPLPQDRQDGRDVCILLDFSGSMSDFCIDGSTPRIQKLAEQVPLCIFSDHLVTTDFIKIVGFADYMHTVLEYTQKNTLQPQDIENLNLRNRCANLGKGFGGGTQLWKSIEQCIKSQEESHPNRPFLFLAFTDGEDSSSSQPVVDLLSTSSGLKFHLSVMGSIVSPNSELNRIPSINWSISEEIDIIVPFIELVNPTTPIPLPPMPVPVIVPPPVVVPVVWNNIITPCRVCNLEVYNGPNKCFFVKSDVHLSCSKCSLCHVQLGNNNYLKEHASVTMFALLCNSPNKAHKDEGKRLDDLRFKSKLPSRRLN